MTSYAKVVKDSLAPNGNRLTTVEVYAPYHLLSVFWQEGVHVTHKVVHSPCPPQELNGKFWVRNLWWAGVTILTVLNRLLRRCGLSDGAITHLDSGFCGAKFLITGINWEPLFRPSLTTLPEANRILREVLYARSNSIPIKLQPGEWHLPYIPIEEYQRTPNTSEGIRSVRNRSLVRCVNFGTVVGNEQQEFVLWTTEQLRQHGSLRFPHLGCVTPDGKWGMLHLGRSHTTMGGFHN